MKISWKEDSTVYQLEKPHNHVIVKISWKEDSLLALKNPGEPSHGVKDDNGSPADNNQHVGSSNNGISSSDTLLACYGITMYHVRGPVDETQLKIQVDQLSIEIIKY